MCISNVQPTNPEQATNEKNQYKRRNKDVEHLTAKLERVNSPLGLWIHGYFMALLDLLANWKDLGFEEGVDEKALRKRITKEEEEE